jgi:hypothetical protein
MTALSWLVVVSLVLVFYLGYSLMIELRQLRAVLTERVGALAEATWRIRDELAKMNKQAGVQFAAPETTVFGTGVVDGHQLSNSHSVEVYCSSPSSQNLPSSSIG